MKAFCLLLLLFGGWQSRLIPEQNPQLRDEFYQFLEKMQSYDGFGKLSDRGACRALKLKWEVVWLPGRPESIRRGKGNLCRKAHRDFMTQRRQKHGSIIGAAWIGNKYYVTMEQLATGLPRTVARYYEVKSGKRNNEPELRLKSAFREVAPEDPQLADFKSMHRQLMGDSAIFYPMQKPDPSQSWSPIYWHKWGWKQKKYAPADSLTSWKLATEDQSFTWNQIQQHFQANTEDILISPRPPASLPKIAFPLEINPSGWQAGRIKSMLREDGPYLMLYRKYAYPYGQVYAWEFQEVVIFKKVEN